MKFQDPLLHIALKLIFIVIIMNTLTATQSQYKSTIIIFKKDVNKLYFILL